MEFAVRDSVAAIIGTLENEECVGEMNFSAGSVSLPAEAGGWLRSSGELGDGGG